MKRPFSVIVLCSAALYMTSGCAAVDLTGRAVGTAGRLAVATAKTTGKIVGKTVVATGKGIKTVVNMAVGRDVVKLTRKGNSLLVDTVLNRRLKTKLILDTGCTDTQISEEVAKRLGISAGQGRIVSCQLADGRNVSGREVNIKEVRLGRAKVSNVRAIVLDCKDGSCNNGLLGMSFLNNFIFKVDSEKEELILQKRI